VLAYSTIGQVGYVLVALGIGGAVGFSAAVIYAVVNSLNKALLFLVTGVRGPFVGAAFAVGAFSLMGVPPAVGFVGKIAVLKAGLAAGGTAQAAILIALIFSGSALSFVYAMQIYQRAFLSKEPQGGLWGKTSPWSARALVVALGVLVLAMGLWPEPLIVLGEEAATALIEGGGSS
jgi:multicomponent Na+:H+ antiporter subunit D